MDRPWVVEYFSESRLRWDVLSPGGAGGLTMQEATEEAPRENSGFPAVVRIRNIKTGEIVEVKA